MDRALRGNRLTKKPKTQGARPQSMSKRDTRSDSDDAWRKSLGSGEILGLSVSGGIKGKPHSTKEGRIASGERKITRFFYGRDKKKKKGVPV